MPTYKGSRPSVRSIKASAAKPDSRTTTLSSSKKYTVQSSDEDDGLLADPVKRKQASREEAEAIVMARYPQYFKTIDQIRKDGGGSIRDANFTYKSYREAREEAIKDTLGTLQSRYEREYQSERELLDPIRREQDRMARDKIFREEQESGIQSENERVTGEANTKTNPRQFFSKNERANMNRAEAYSAAGLTPESQASFSQVQDFFQELQQMDPEQQKQALDEIRSEANDSVDSYYDDRTEQVRTRLSEKISQLNAKHGLLSETEQYKLERAVGTLDREVAEKLDQGIEEIFKRGGADSGLMQRLADEIISGRMVEVADAEKVFDLNVKGSEQQKAADKKNAELSASEDLYDIEQERTSERSQAFSDVVNDRLQQGLLQQIMSGAGNIPNGPTAQGLAGTTADAKKAPASRTPTSLEIARGLLPSAKAPAGSSLDLARQQQAGTISIDQQRTAREALLFPNGRPNAVAAPPSPVKPVATVKKPATSAVKNPVTGVSYSGAAAARLAARISSR